MLVKTRSSQFGSLHNKLNVQHVTLKLILDVHSDTYILSVYIQPHFSTSKVLPK